MVLFNKRKTNLHFVWDFHLLNKIQREDFNGNIENFELFILNSMNSQNWVDFHSWISCDIKNPYFSVNLHSHTCCVQQWVGEINRLNCESVWVYEPGDDLADEKYFNRNKNEIFKLMAKAAYRLAYLLNSLLF